MAWSDAARRAAAIVRRMRSAQIKYLKETGAGEGAGLGAVGIGTFYRQRLARTIKATRKGNLSAFRGAAAARAGATSTIARNSMRRENREHLKKKYLSGRRWDY